MEIPIGEKQDKEWIELLTNFYAQFNQPNEYQTDFFSKIYKTHTF